MIVNLLICWTWLTFIGMRLFGPGRQTTFKENKEEDGEENGGYDNFAMESESNENKGPQKSSIEEKEAEISLEELSTDKQNKNLQPSYSLPGFSRDNSKTGQNNFFQLLQFSEYLILSISQH